MKVIGSQAVLQKLYPVGTVRDVSKAAQDGLIALEFRLFMANWWEAHKNTQPHEYWCRIRSLANKRMGLLSVAKRKQTIGLIREHKFPYHFTGQE